MPVYPIPDNPQVCKVAMVFQRDSRFFVNTFHVARPASTWTLALMGDLALAANNWWAIYYKLTQPAQIALVQVQVRLYNPANPLAVDYPVTPPVVGLRAGTPEAANATLTMSWRTGLAGRAFRGRMYVPALVEADVSVTDTVGSVVIAAFAVAADAFVHTSFTASPPVIFHRPGLVPRPRDNTYTPVTTYVMENVVDSQRRRLPGRGR